MAIYFNIKTKTENILTIKIFRTMFIDTVPIAGTQTTLF